MKMRPFLLLAATLLVGIGSAHAQSLTCIPNSIPFPPPGSSTEFIEPSGLCIESQGGTGRLRWDDNKSGRLELFDTDDSGSRLWCAHLHDGDTTCAVGKSFCLQSTGNAVIFDGDNCAGNVLWTSKTANTNINGEVMGVADNFSDCHGVSFLGEKAVIVNNFNSRLPCIVFSSNSSDPS